MADSAPGQALAIPPVTEAPYLVLSHDPLRAMQCAGDSVPDVAEGKACRRHQQHGLLDEWFSRHSELAKFVLHRAGRPMVACHVLKPVLVRCREALLKQSCCLQ
jgi:hypothetical protein